MIPRSEVYDVIDGERSYQDALPPSRTDGAERTVGDYLTMLRFYITQAEADWTLNPGNVPALGQIRKVAAIAVRCMEEHGAPERRGSSDSEINSDTPAFGDDSGSM